MTVRGDTVMLLDASGGLDILDQPNWLVFLGLEDGKEQMNS